MGAGRLDRRLTIRSATTASDGRGGQTTTWVDGSRVWAAVESLSGRESLQVGAIQNQAAHLVTIRYLSEITVKSRLYWEDRSKTLEVVSLREIGRKRWMELECVEVDS